MNGFVSEKRITHAEPPRLPRASRDCAPAQIVERILDEILAFGKHCSQKDDMTLVVAAVKDEV